ncbi:hypothetical protein UPYG_G00054130, partial [Umbra pygmaea]
MSIPGPHVFLLVIRIGVRKKKEENTVKWIQKYFGDDFSMYTIVLFTHGDLLQSKSIKEFCQENEELQSLINQCGSRYHVFNNKEKNEQTQVWNLLKKIDDMVEWNGRKHYTSEMYEKAQEKIIWEERVEIGKKMAAEAGNVAIGVGMTTVGLATTG